MACIQWQFRRARRVGLYLCSAMIALCCVGCTAVLERPPDLGSIDEYPIQHNAGQLSIGVEFPDNINRELGDDIRIFGYFGLLAMNIKIINNDDLPYLIQREEISLTLDNGKRYIPLTRQKAVEQTTGTFGIRWYRQDFPAAISQWAFQEKVLLPPNGAVTGYLFFDVGQRYDDVKFSYVEINPMKLRTIDTFLYTFEVNRGEKL